MQTFSVMAPAILTALLKYECDPNFCREAVPVLAGDDAARKFEIGTILAMVSATEVTAEARAANAAGTGALALADPAAGNGAVPGIYQVICIEPAAAGGIFEVFDPSGVSIGTAKVGVAFTGDVKFTIADGNPDFVAGEGFAITVPTGNKAVAWDPDGVDGSQIVHSVSLARGGAPDGADGVILAAVRGPSIMLGTGLIWPEGTTGDQKTAALAALAAKNIIVRNN